jgi:hypothetical protein
MVIYIDEERSTLILRSIFYIRVLLMGQSMSRGFSWASMVQPPELFRLKRASHRYTDDTNSTHFNRNNLLVCRVSARYNHGSTESKQIYLARRRVYNHTIAYKLLVHGIIKHYYKLFRNLK